MIIASLNINNMFMELVKHQPYKKNTIVSNSVLIIATFIINNVFGHRKVATEYNLKHPCLDIHKYNAIYLNVNKSHKSIVKCKAIAPLNITSFQKAF